MTASPPAPASEGRAPLHDKIRQLSVDARALVELIVGRESPEAGTVQDPARLPPTTVPPSRPGVRSWLGKPERSARADCTLITLAVVSVGVSAASDRSVVRLAIVLAAACLIPGAALLTRLGVDDLLQGFTLAVALGFSVEAVGSLAMVWSGWWHPVGWALVLLGGACVLLVLDLRCVVVGARRSDLPVGDPQAAP